MRMALKKGDKIRKGKYMAPSVFEGRKITKVMWEEALYKYMHKTHIELKQLLQDPGQTPAFELMVISILTRAIGGGDPVRAEFLLKRMIGPVVEKIELETNDVSDQAKTEQLASKILEALKK
jgi:hypothetical protein